MNSKTGLLRDRLQKGRPIVRVMGAHNAMGAKLIEQHGFDAVWASGLEISTAHALPDANILTMTENLETARAIHESTLLPVICDCDTGYGNATQVMHMVRRYEAAEIAAVVIEDKCFPKINSLLSARQELASIEEFVGKIEAAKEAQVHPDFLVIARVEALIAGLGMEEALKRAHSYADAGADAIVIHSKAKTPMEVFLFAEQWKRNVPLVAIPTTYYRVTASDLEKGGFSMVIYANQGLRAAIRGMKTVFEQIRREGTAASVESEIATLEEVFEIQGMKDMQEDEERFVRGENVQAVIPAARGHHFQPDLAGLLQDKPLCMLDIGGRTLLDRQIDLLRSAGIGEIFVVGGHLHDRIQAQGAQVLYNPGYAQCHCAGSILFARDRLKDNVLILYSDIVFDRQILEILLKSPHPLTLVIDRAYKSLPLRDKALDLVQVDSPHGDVRRLDLGVFKPIRDIGKKIRSGEPTHEFIGIALLREEGIRQLGSAWEEALAHFSGRSFYEAPSAEMADFTDLLRLLLDKGTPVHGMEIEQGWSEIHSREDYLRVQTHYSRTASLPV